MSESDTTYLQGHWGWDWQGSCSVESILSDPGGLAWNLSRGLPEPLPCVPSGTDDWLRLFNVGQQSDYSEKAGRCVAVRLAERLAEHMGYLVWSRLPISTSGGQSWMILLKKLVATALAAKRLLPTSSSSCCFMKLALRSMEKTSHGFRRWIQWIVLPYSDRLLLQVAGNLQNGPHFSLFYHPSAPSSVCHILSPRTCGLRQRHSVHEWGVSGLPAKKNHIKHTSTPVGRSPCLELYSWEVCAVLQTSNQ